MNHRTAPPYPGSKEDYEKKKTILFVVSLVLFGVIYAVGSPFLDSSKPLAFVIMIPLWILIFVVHNHLHNWITNDYSEKRRVWCDFWEAYDHDLKQLKREYQNLPDGDAKLDLQLQIMEMENYWHKFDNYA